MDWQQLREELSRVTAQEVVSATIVLLVLLGVLYVFLKLVYHMLFLLPLVSMGMAYILLVLFDHLRADMSAQFKRYAIGRTGDHFVQLVTQLGNKYPIHLRTPISETTLLLAAILVVFVFGLALISSKFRLLQEEFHCSKLIQEHIQRINEERNKKLK